MTDILLIVFVSISVFMASLFSTVTGFGFALVAVPFLMPVLGAHETVVFIIFGTCLVKMIVLWNTRKHFEWHTVAVTVAGSVLGSLPGSYLLNAISPAYLQILLGTVLVIVLFMMGMHFDLSVKNKTVGRITAGFLSGFSAATTSISGPPVALYFLTEGRDKLVTRANMCWIFAFGNIGTMFSLALSGSSISGDLMLLAAYVTLPMLLGTWIGERCFYRRLHGVIPRHNGFSVKFTHNKRQKKEAENYGYIVCLIYFCKCFYSFFVFCRYRLYAFFGGGAVFNAGFRA